MNVRRAVVPVVCLIASLSAVLAQPRVDPINNYERVIAIVPIIGQGTAADPQRPMYTPVFSANAPAPTTAFIAFASEISDDGKFAIVEFVARDLSAFQAILADSTIKTFLKGRDTRQAAAVEFLKLKKDFSIANFGVRIP